MRSIDPMRVSHGSSLRCKWNQVTYLLMYPTCCVGSPLLRLLLRQRLSDLAKWPRLRVRIEIGLSLQLLCVELTLCQLAMIKILGR